MTPTITIFVRHGFSKGKPCPYTGDESARRCKCPKHLRWTMDGVRHRAKTGTRSWAEAEKAKRRLEDQLSGKSEPEQTRGLADAIDVFLQDKKVQGVSRSVYGKYALE